MTRYLAIAFLTSGALSAGPALGMSFGMTIAWAYSVVAFLLIVTIPRARVTIPRAR